MSYTALALVATAVTVGLDAVVLRTRLLRRRIFWVSYAIVVVFQLLVNGVLAGHRVVTYNAHDVIGGSAPHLVGGGRLGYAPVEDLLFGFALVTQTLCWWVWLGRRGVQR